MKIKLPLLILLLCFLPVIGMTADDQTAAIDGSAISWDPKALHQEMWDNLKPRLARMQQESALAADKNASNWTEYDMGYHKIDLTIDHIDQIIYGRVDSYGKVVVNSLDSVKINFLNTMTVDSVYNGTGNLAFTHDSDHLTVHLGRSFLKGEQFQFTVVYHGHPSSSEGFLGLSFSTRNNLPLITTLSEPMGARSWWPCNDIPRDKLDSVDMIVTVDTSLVVSSNGLVVSEVNNGNGTHTTHWATRYPIAPYLVSLAIHPYAVWFDYYNYTPTDSMPVEFFVYPDHNMYSRTFFDGVVAHMLQVLSGIYGQYPFINEKYGCTHFDWGGAMEHQTNTSTTATSFGYSQPVIVHELSHQWWGDMVTCEDWHHIWLNEGFAVYSEALYFEADSGLDYYHQYMNDFEYTSGGRIYIDDTTDIWNIFSARVYDKGGWVLHMLRHIVGDDAFFQAFADYRDEYTWKSATTEDFQAVVEAASGMDLDWFFQEWIYGTYRPNYRYAYLTQEDPDGGWNTYLHIRQIQTTDPEVFTMPIDIRLSYSAAQETRVIYNDAREQNFILHTDDKPIDLALDPDRWISRQAAVETYTAYILTESLLDGNLLADYSDTVQAKGQTDNFDYEIVAGALPSGLSLDPSTGIISSQPREFGSFTFTVMATNTDYIYYSDEKEYTIEIGQPLANYPGDVNIDGSVDVGDAVYLINYIFKNGSSPVVADWADSNADCHVNVGDIVYLINFIFRDGAAPLLGCVD